MSACRGRGSMSVLTSITPWRLSGGGGCGGRRRRPEADGAGRAARPQLGGPRGSDTAFAVSARRHAMAWRRPGRAAPSPEPLPRRKPCLIPKVPSGLPDKRDRLRRCPASAAQRLGRRYRAPLSPVPRYPVDAPLAGAPDASKGVRPEGLPLPPAGPLGRSCGLGGFHPPVPPAL